jgi:hypothetical protein
MAWSVPDDSGTQVRYQPEVVLAAARRGLASRRFHGVCVGEDLWDAYDKMGRSFQRHAVDSAANAHYDRPAVLAALGPVTGRRVLDAACGPACTWANCWSKGPRSPPLMRAR